MVGPIDSASDALGSVYIAAYYSNNVFRVRRDGTPELVLDASGDGLGNDLLAPSKVLISDTGDIYVLGSGSHNIFRVHGTELSSLTKLLSQMQPERPAGISLDTEIVYGDGAANTLGMTGDSQIVIALGGDDVLVASARQNTFYGGDGDDIARFPNGVFDYAISQNPLTGDTQLIARDGRLAGLVAGDVERMGFSDTEISNRFLGYWGETLAASPTPSEEAVHRFFNVASQSFFYTADLQEATVILANSALVRDATVRWPYVYQGATFSAAHSYEGSIDLHRFYNAETGHHFFTASDEERVYVQSQIDAGKWPYVYEGIAYQVYPEDPTPDTEGNEVPVFRYYSATLNRHAYTADEKEALLFIQSSDWEYEGLAFFAEKP